MSLILALLLWATPLNAEVCFTEEQASGILIEVERGRLCEEQVEQYVEATKELSIQLDALRSQIETTNQKFDETVRQLGIERKLAEEKDKARLEEIKQASKPQWKMLFGGFGAGAILVGVLVLLL